MLWMGLCVNRVAMNVDQFLALDGFQRFQESGFLQLHRSSARIGGETTADDGRFDYAVNKTGCYPICTVFYQRDVTGGIRSPQTLLVLWTQCCLFWALHEECVIAVRVEPNLHLGSSGVMSQVKCGHLGHFQLLWCLRVLGIECWPVHCALTFHPGTDAPLHEVSTVQLVASPNYRRQFWLV